MNIDVSETVIVAVEGKMSMVFPVKTATVTKNGNCVVCKIKFVYALLLQSSLQWEGCKWLVLGQWLFNFKLQKMLHISAD